MSEEKGPGKTYSTSVYLDTSNHRVFSSCFLSTSCMYTYFISFTSLFLSIFCVCCRCCHCCQCSGTCTCLYVWLFSFFIIRVWQDSCMIGFEGVGVKEYGMLILSFFSSFLVCLVLPQSLCCLTRTALGGWRFDLFFCWWRSRLCVVFSF